MGLACRCHPAIAVEPGLCSTKAHGVVGSSKQPHGRSGRHTSIWFAAPDEATALGEGRGPRSLHRLSDSQKTCSQEGKLAWTSNGSILKKLFVADDCEVMSVRSRPPCLSLPPLPLLPLVSALWGAYLTGLVNEALGVGAVAVCKGGGVCAS